MEDHEELTLDDWKAALKAACRDARYWEERAQGWQARLLGTQQDMAALQASWEQKVSELHEAQKALSELRGGGRVDDLTARREARNGG